VARTVQPGGPRFRLSRLGKSVSLFSAGRVQAAEIAYNIAMRPIAMVVLLLSSALLRPAMAADCFPVEQAREHIGEEQCIAGKVFRVKHGSRGTTYFDFCDDFRICPFSVVIFAGHLKDIGDVSQLTNRVIEVHGTLKQYDGRAEIVVQDARQLGGEGTHIPKLPKNYDVENKGHYSAGTFSLPKAPRAKYPKKQPETLPLEIPDDND